MINELSKIIHENNKAKGFYDSQKNIGEMLALIHSEVSEALEAHRKDKYAVKSWNLENNVNLDALDSNSEKQYFQQEFTAAIKDTFEDELADVVIRVLDLAAFMGVDMEYHIKMKLAYNKLRPHKHGKNY